MNFSVFLFSGTVYFEEMALKYSVLEPTLSTLNQKVIF